MDVLLDARSRRFSKIHSEIDAVRMIYVFERLLSAAQRRLSTPVRELRRRTAEVSGTQVMRSGERRELDAESIAAPLEGALRALWLAVVILAIGLVAVRDVLGDGGAAEHDGHAGRARDAQRVRPELEARVAPVVAARSSFSSAIRSSTVGT